MCAKRDEFDLQGRKYVKNGGTRVPCRGTSVRVCRVLRRAASGDGQGCSRAGRGVGECVSGGRVAPLVVNIILTKVCKTKTNAALAD